MSDQCNHDYIVDKFKHGICKLCKQEVQFDPENKMPPLLIKVGNPPEINAGPERPQVITKQTSTNDKKTKYIEPVNSDATEVNSVSFQKMADKPQKARIKMTKALEKELLEAGPREFVNKYYPNNNRAMGHFVQMYRKLGGVYDNNRSVQNNTAKKRSVVNDTAKKRTVQTQTNDNITDSPSTDTKIIQIPMISRPNNHFIIDCPLKPSRIIIEFQP